MDNRKLLLDVMIIVVFLIISGLVYLAYPQQIKSPEPEKVVANANLSASEESTMPETQTAAQLKVEIVKEGTGKGVENGQTLVVHYTGKLTDGTVFDSSVSRNEPFPVLLGAGQVIPGWELGLLGMKKGEERKLTIPPELAYGEKGFPGVIPPSATLVFDVSAIEIR